MAFPAPISFVDFAPAKRLLLRLPLRRRPWFSVRAPVGYQHEFAAPSTCRLRRGCVPRSAALRGHRYGRSTQAANRRHSARVTPGTSSMLWFRCPDWVKIASFLSLRSYRPPNRRRYSSGQKQRQAA